MYLIEIFYCKKNKKNMLMQILKRKVVKIKINKILKLFKYLKNNIQ